jgi:hypothetical protein
MDCSSKCTHINAFPVPLIVTTSITGVVWVQCLAEISHADVSGVAYVNCQFSFDGACEMK